MGCHLVERSRQSDSLCILQPGIYRADDHARFDCQQLNSDECDARENIDHATAIKYAINDLRETRTVCRMLNISSHECILPLTVEPCTRMPNLELEEESKYSAALG